MRSQAATTMNATALAQSATPAIKAAEAVVAIGIGGYI